MAAAVRCARCDATWTVTSPRVRRRGDARWVCASPRGCEGRKMALIAAARAALERAHALMARLGVLPDELVQAGRR